MLKKEEILKIITDYVGIQEQLNKLDFPVVAIAIANRFDADVRQGASSADVLLAELWERLEKQRLILYKLEADTKHDRQEYHMMEGKEQLLVELIKFYSK